MNVIEILIVSSYYHRVRYEEYVNIEENEKDENEIMEIITTLR